MLQLFFLLSHSELTLEVKEGAKPSPRLEPHGLWERAAETNKRRFCWEDQAGHEHQVEPPCALLGPLGDPVSGGEEFGTGLCYTIPAFVFRGARFNLFLSHKAV